MIRSRLRGSPRLLISRIAGLVLGIAVVAGCSSNVTPEPPVGDDEPVAGTPADEPAADDEPSQAQPEVPADVPTEPVGDCSAAGASITAPELSDMPDDVVAMRDFLLDAALRCDEQLLQTAINESDMFTYSFGDEGDALGYWWRLEEDGDEPFLRLAQVLATTPAVADGGEVVVWPQVTTGRPENTTDDAWSELAWLTAEEIEAYRGEVGYLGYRVGVSTDGQWRFFVAGD